MSRKRRRRASNPLLYFLASRRNCSRLAILRMLCACLLLFAVSPLSALARPQQAPSLFSQRPTQGELLRAIQEEDTCSAPEPDHSEPGRQVGGFPANATDGTCPDAYRAIRGLCWASDGQPYVQVQNRFMQCFDSSNKFREVDCHRVQIMVMAGDNSVTGNLPVPNLPLNISHNSLEDVRVLVNDQHWLTIPANGTVTMRTNVAGKCDLSVENDDSFEEPIFYIHAPFDEPDKAIAFLSKAHALHAISQLNATDLSKMGTNNGTVPSPETASATSEALQHLLVPALDSQIVAVNDDGDGNLHKRSLHSDFTADDSTAFKHQDSYHDVSNVVRGHKVSTAREVTRVLRTHRFKGPMEFHFDSAGTGSGVTHHTDASAQAAKQRLHEMHHIYKRSYIPEWHPEAYVNSDPERRLVKRHYYSDLRRKAKDTWVHTKQALDLSFKKLPIALFNITSAKNDSRIYLEGVQRAMSDAIKKDTEVGRDVISLLPFGDVLNRELGIDDLVRNITNSTNIIVTPFTFGLELFILGPREATRLFVTSFKSLGAVLKGILLKIGVTLKKVFAYVRRIFNWDDILLNHRVLTSHYNNMIPYIKNHITSDRNNFTSGVTDTLTRLGDVTEQATTLFVTGNITSLGELIAQANKEIYRNLTDTKPIDSNTTPLDIQSSFVSDKIASSAGQMQVDVDPATRQGLLTVITDSLMSMTGVAQSTGESLWFELKLLAAELSKSNWNMDSILPILFKLFRFSVQLVLEKVVQGILIIINFLLTVFDKLLRTHIKIPYLADFYETVVTRGKGSKFTVYDLFALGAVVPLTVAFRAFNNNKNILTQQEADVLMATADPELYIENMVGYAMQVPNQNATSLRRMYRCAVSYILGSGYASGQVLSAAVGFTGAGRNKPFALWAMRAPFELMSVLCNYPWSWYTETRTSIGINIRFVGWVAQFLPFMLGWPISAGRDIPGIHYLHLVAFIGGVVPNLYMIIRVWLQDLKLFHADPGANVDGVSKLDVSMKSIARIMTNLPHIMAALPDFSVYTFLTLQGVMMAGALMHSARLYIDIPGSAIYSV